MANAYMTIQINTGSFAVGDFNTALSGGSSKPEETITNIINILNAIKIGAHSGTISVSSSTTAGTVSGQTGGTAVFSMDLT